MILDQPAARKGGELCMNSQHRWAQQPAVTGAIP
jgi:hypothetical protein